MTRGQIIAIVIMALCGPLGWLLLGFFWWKWTADPKPTA